MRGMQLSVLMDASSFGKSRKLRFHSPLQDQKVSSARSFQFPHTGSTKRHFPALRWDLELNHPARKLLPSWSLSSCLSTAVITAWCLCVADGSMTGTGNAEDQRQDANG